MIKVFQRLVDKEKGDCMQAAVASLLELPYEDVPKFIEHKEGWFHPFYDLIVAQGLTYKGMLHNDIDKTDMHEPSFVGTLYKYKGLDGYFLASVYSPKYFIREDISSGAATTHAVLIDREFNIVHDPNPNNQDVKKYPLADELGYNGIINIIILEK